MREILAEALYGGYSLRPTAAAAASRVQLRATPRTAAQQAPPSLEFSGQEHWSGLPFPSPVHACMLSHRSRVRLCVTLWTAAQQAPASLGFSRQEYCSGLPFPSLRPTRQVLLCWHR